MKGDEEKCLAIDASDETIFNEAEIERKKDLVNEYLIKYSGYLKCLKIKK